MIEKIIMLCNLLCYSLAVSQAFFYVLGLKSAQLELEASSYLSFRKAIDSQLRKSLRLLFYISAVFALLQVLVQLADGDRLAALISGIAALALIADMLIAVRLNMPLNNEMNTWDADNYPENWTSIRTRWLYVYCMRQTLLITGFVALIICDLFLG